MKTLMVFMVIALSWLTISNGFTAPCSSSLSRIQTNHRKNFAINPNNPGSDLFPAQGSSYVPSGLTAEEYSEIKRKEKEAEEKMNYGQWGPRFSAASRPDGDWFVVPSLWTGGFSVNDLRKKSPNGGVEPQNRMPQPNVYAFVLAYVFLESIGAAISMWMASRVMRSSTFWLGMKFLLWTRRVGAPTMGTQEVIRMHLMKLVAAGILTVPTNQILTELNRKRLWSQKGAFLSILGAVVVSLGGWTAILVRFRCKLPL